MPKGIPIENSPNQDGLSVQQRRVLMTIASGKSMSEACELEGIDKPIFNKWMRSPDFLKAFDDLFNGEDLKNLKKQLQLSALAAVEVYEDTIRNAVSKVRAVVICPHCQKDHVVWVDVADYKSKLHAADILLKISDILIDKRHDKIDITQTHTVQLGPMESLEVLAWKHGLPLPPAREAFFREHGFIEGVQPNAQLPPGTVEGEYKEV